MIKENKISINNLIISILFLVLGIILLTTSSNIIELISKIIGVILIIIGIVKSIVYVYMKGKLGNYRFKELILGLIIICFGVLFILFSSTLGITIRTLVGIWILFVAINRIIFAISVKKMDSVGFKMYFITSLLMICVSVLLISGIFDKIVGLFIIIYASLEIINYIYYKTSNKMEETKNEKKKVKRIQNKKVVDAIVEEDEN